MQNYVHQQTYCLYSAQHKKCGEILLDLVGYFELSHPVNKVDTDSLRSWNWEENVSDLIVKTMLDDGIRWRNNVQ